MPHYKLYYFDVRGRAEGARILLSLAGADWEDFRKSLGDKYIETNIKPKCPYSQMPILEFDGVVLGQSMAILRYLARTFGFVPQTSLQTAIGDGIVDQIQDCSAKDVILYFEKDPSRKVVHHNRLICIFKMYKYQSFLMYAGLIVKILVHSTEMHLEELKKQVEDIVLRSLQALEKIFNENSGGKTFFFGDKITYADVHFFDYANSVLNGGKLEVPDILKEYPGLTKLYNGILNEPKILAYLKKRPQTIL